MALVKPFKGIRYNPDSVDLGDVVTLPYDVISDEKRNYYSGLSDLSFINLILPKNGASRYENARKTMDSWISSRVLVEDDSPAFYWYREEYVLDGVSKSQEGLVALVRLEDFGEKVILPHEEIYKGPLEDRYHLLRETKADLEMIMGVYSDGGEGVSSIVDGELSNEPLIDLSHEDNIRHLLWRVEGENAVSRVGEFFSQKKIIIADGHHRYTTALKYHFAENGRGEPYILMWLLDVADTVVYPTHRLLCNVGDLARIVERLEPYFEVCECGSKEGLVKALDEGGRHSFGFYSKGRRLLLTLRDNGLVSSVLDRNGKSHWRDLDVNIAHSVIIHEVLGLPEDAGHIHFVKGAKKMFSKVDGGAFDVGLLMKPTDISDVISIAGSGRRMPQKSTYFYPKPLSGLVFARH